MALSLQDPICINIRLSHGDLYRLTRLIEAQNKGRERTRLKMLSTRENKVMTPKAKPITWTVISNILENVILQVTVSDYAHIIDLVNKDEDKRVKARLRSSKDTPKSSRVLLERIKIEPVAP